jgi:CRP/FNR family transcriptional regulator, cyclic AMP receptor protein
MSPTITRERASPALPRLRSNSLFGTLSQLDLAELADRFVYRSFPKGAVIYRRGEPGRILYLVDQGAVKLGTSTPDGREAAYAIMGPGEVFGILSFFDPPCRSADASALVRSRALSLAHEQLRPYLERSPPLADAFTNLIATRARDARELASAAVFEDISSRLLDRMLDLARRFGIPVPGGRLVDLPLAQQDLAEMVGASRESVNKALASLARRRIIRCEERRYVVLTETG